MNEIYQPAEDSYLMSGILRGQLPNLLNENPNLIFLEIGCGSGINLKMAKSLGIKLKNIFSCDINPSAVKHCVSLGYNCIKSNLFENIKGKYDIIIFNPPYLPEDKYDKKYDTSGGKKGNEIIIKFLKQAKSHLIKSGIIFLLTSSLTPNINFDKYGYKSKQIEEKKLFYEKLWVWGLNV